MTGREQLAKALRAIRQGRTMGQFLRDLPNSAKLSKQELQVWAKVYVEARNRAMGKFA